MAKRMTRSEVAPGAVWSIDITTLFGILNHVIHIQRFWGVMKHIAIALVFLWGISTVSATTIHVPAERPTIQAAINVSRNGDTVLVSPGTYTETFNFAGKLIVVKSAAGPLLTTINGSSSNDAAHPTVLIANGETASAILEGFTLKGGPIAILCNGSGPTIRGNVCTGQTYQSWAAVVIQGPAIVIGNTVCNGANGGVACYSTQALLANNIFAFNGGYGVASDGTPLTLSYNDVFGNGQNYANIPNPGYPSIIEDPQFIDRLSGDYRLQSGTSPCVDAGDPNPLFNDPDGTRGDMGALPWTHQLPIATNINFGVPIPDHLLQLSPTIFWSFHGENDSPNGYQIELGTDVDWSVAEVWTVQVTNSADTNVTYYGPPLLQGTWYYLRMRVYNGTKWGDWAYAKFRLNSKPTVPLPHWPDQGATVPHNYFSACCENATDPEGDAITYDFEIFSDPDQSQLVSTNIRNAQSTPFTCSGPFTMLLPGLSYWWHCRAFDGLQYSAWSNLRSFNTQNLNSRTIQVPSERPTIQAGIDVASNGDTVLVAPGIYNEIFTYRGKLVVVKSAAGALSTTIIGSTINDESHPTVSFTNGESAAAVLEGFTFKGGPIAIKCSGAGPTIKGNICTDQIYQSHAALVIQGPARVINNTICFGANGGIACYSTQAIIKNNIIAFNGGYGVASDGTSLTLSYNDVFSSGQNYANIPNPGYPSISLDPLFVDQASRDFRLHALTSPCIDAGDPDPLYNDPDGTRNDMGALSLHGTNPDVSPTINSPTLIDVNEDARVVYRCTAIDPDGPTLTWSFKNKPSWLVSSVDSIYGTPHYPVHDTSFSIIASDGFLADTQTVSVRVHQLTPEVPIVRVDSDSLNLHVLSFTPQISWHYFDPTGTTPQTEFDIAVGTDNEWTYSEMWNPAPFMSPDSFVAYGGITLVRGHTYYLRLRAYNGTRWSPYKYGSFRLNSKPSVPVAKTPTDDQITGSTPVLWVQNATDGENDVLFYDFQGFHDTDCVGGASIAITHVVGGTDSTGGQVTTSLGEDCRYWWQVRSFDGYEYSDWSSNSQFRVNGVSEPPSVFTLTSPPMPDNKPVFTLLPVLQWNQSTDPDPGDTVRYKVELSLSAGFGLPFIKDSLLATQFQLPDSLQFGTRYWWRVSAKDRTGNVTMCLSPKDFWTWRLGDVNSSHSTDLADLSTLVSFLTGGGATITPRIAGDLNADCRINLADLSVLVSYLTGGGAVLRAGC